MANLKESYSTSLDLPFLILPFEYTGEREIKRLLSFFGPAIILLPWQMESDHLPFENKNIQVVYPPREMDPGPKFHNILKEHKAWISTHNDRGVVGFLRFWDQAIEEKESVWDIKRIILGREVEIKIPPKDAPALRRHLLLHLAMEMSKNITELEVTLKRLKVRDRVLKGAVEDDSELMGILRDVPINAPDTLIPPEQLRRLLDASLGLFNQKLKEIDIIYIKDKRLINLILEELSDYMMEEGKSANQIRFHWPDLSELSYEEMEKKKEILLNSEKVKEFRNKFMDLNPKELAHLEDLSHQISKSFTEDAKENRIAFTLTYIPPLESSYHDPFLIFQNKFIIN